ncbi:SIR2 family protein [Schlesneria paludicola]|uniref:SIR2 family protein n=1 Tax=Schlesneria paludicola TaxID=360056 RepID=UPI00029B42FE|nr:SIR2 family protein [Schlesneria paludicola]
MRIDDEDFFNVIKIAWRNGRPIVPIIGAGASADSGFPPLASIVRYIAKLSCYLTHKLYLPPSASESLFRTQVKLFAERPDEFISIFGWPDRFQLNADLRARIGEMDAKASPRKEWEIDPRRGSRGLMDAALSHALDALAQKINPGGYWHLDRYLSNSIRNTATAIESAFKANRISSSLRAKLLESLQEPSDIQSFRYQVVGDWKPLLRHVTWYHPELVDALFSRLARNRAPGSTHTMLAHLSHLLRIRALFTFNFDPFIETALARENVSHRVFAMEHGTELPSRHHLDDSVSVIKMHGSTHNILVDERVDYRVSDRYKQQFLQLIGENPLLLVIGCSGSDRRLVDLVSDVMNDVSDATAVWMHHSKRDDVPASLRDRRRLSHYATYDLGRSFQRLFEELTERLPNSTAPYVAHIDRPTIPQSGQNGKSQYEVHKRPITIFSAIPRAVAKDFPSTSRDFLYALAEVPQGYTIVHVDLEEHHTLEQVAAEIVDQIRRGDTALPPFVTSGGISEQDSGNDSCSYAISAADRVVNALRRSRYALCISGIDAFPFRPTTHHGVTREFSPKDRARFRLLIEFLLHITRKVSGDWTLGDSFVVLAHEMAYGRHCREDLERASQKGLQHSLNDWLNRSRRIPKVLLHVPKLDSDRSLCEATEKEQVVTMEELKAPFYSPAALRDFSLVGRSENDAVASEIESAKSGISPTQGLTVAVMVTAVLAFHRRTRTKLGIKHLVSDIFRQASYASADVSKPNGHVTQITLRLKDASKCPHWMSWTKEDGLWLDRPARDWIYDFNTRFTTEGQLSKRDEHPRAFLQIVMAAIIHDRIARNYYLNQFLPSRDPFFFMEYVYHRMSTLRYLAQLQAMSFDPQFASTVTAAHTIHPLFADCNVDDHAAGCKSEPTGILAFYADGSDWKEFFASIADVARSVQYGPKLQSTVQRSVRAIRGRCVQGLTETWVRSESYIRQALPPEQVVTWCENLLDYNLGESSIPLEKRNANDRTSALHAGLVKGLFTARDKRSVIAKKNLQIAESKNEVTQIRRGLVDAIKNTLFRGMYAHASYLKIVDHEWLFSGLDQSKSDARHWELNRSVARLWACNCRGDTIPGTRGEHKFKQLSTTITAQAMKLRRNKRLWGQGSEARLRAFYLEAEAALAPFFVTDGSFSSFGLPVLQLNIDQSRLLEVRNRDQDEVRANEKRIASLNEVIMHLVSAIEEAREENRTIGDNMRNPLLEPTADRGLFIPYRSLFQIQLGRTNLFIAKLLSSSARIEVELARIDNALNGTEIATSFEKAASLMRRSREHLTAAYRDLAYAKHGIGIENSALLAISDLCCAEVGLAGSDHEVAWLYRKGWDYGEKMVRRSQAKLQTASGYLTRSLSRLVQGPRMILLWRLFHMTQVHYHMRRIATIADEVTYKAKMAKERMETSPDEDGDAWTARKVGELVRRVRLAVLGIRFGIDYSVGEDASQFRKRFIRLWAQVAATALYCAAVLAHARQFVDNSLLDTLLSGWFDINQSEGMFAFPDTSIANRVPDNVRSMLASRLAAFREIVKKPLDRMLIIWDDIHDLGGIVFMRDQMWNEFTAPIHEFVITGEGKDWIR